MDGLFCKKNGGFVNAFLVGSVLAPFFVPSYSGIEKEAWPFTGDGPKSAEPKDPGSEEHLF